MFAEQMEQDVACVWGWWDKDKAETQEGYSKLSLPKVPLLITTVSERIQKHARGFLKEEGWSIAGWYPGCHEELATAGKVTLFYKEQDEQPKPIPQQKYPSSFNTSVPLGCSCIPYKTLVKLTLVCDRHRTLGVHRRTARTLRKTYGNWHRFAVTPLASYWFWGLLPDETNRRKFE